MLLVISILILHSFQSENNTANPQIEIGCDELNPFLCPDQKCVNNSNDC